MIYKIIAPVFIIDKQRLYSFLCVATAFSAAKLKHPLCHLSSDLYVALFMFSVPVSVCGDVVLFSFMRA